MKGPITHAQLRTLAFRCETAKSPRCHCRCGGAQHGKAHSEEWIDLEVKRDIVRAHNAPGQIDWVGYEGLDQYL